MRFGLAIGIDQNGLAAAAGFDYLEPGAFELLAAEPDAVFAPVKARALAGPLPIECFNCFVPGHIKLTGPDVNMTAIRAHMESVLSRAAALGAKVMVFGSGAARKCPDDYPKETALAQFTETAALAAAIAGEHGMVIALEPLSYTECNLLNRVDEGVALARQIDSPYCQVLADSYHMVEVGEPFENVVAAGKYLQHVHIDGPDLRAVEEGRRCPVIDFLRVLAQSAYQGRVSLENHSRKFADEESKEAYYRASEQVLRPYIAS